MVASCWQKRRRDFSAPPPARSWPSIQTCSMETSVTAEPWFVSHLKYDYLPGSIVSYGLPSWPSFSQWMVPGKGEASYENDLADTVARYHSRLQSGVGAAV